MTARQPATGAIGDELAEEIATCDAGLAEWKEHEDRFVLIKGSEVNGFFDDYEEALRNRLRTLRTRLLPGQTGAPAPETTHDHTDDRPSKNVAPRTQAIRP